MEVEICEAFVFHVCGEGGERVSDGWNREGTADGQVGIALYILSLSCPVERSASAAEG